MRSLRCTCETVPQPSELRFAVVRAVHAEAWGPHRARGRGGFWGFLFPIFTMGNAIASPTVKCFRFVFANSTTFPFGKCIVGKPDSWAFWRYIHFQDQHRSLREISKNVTIARTHAAPCSGVYF